MELIRLQLLRVEGEKELTGFEDYSEEQKIYHMALCIEAGLVDGHIQTDGNGFPIGASAIRLTWKGHEFLDAARNDTIWKKALVQVKKTGGHVTHAALEELLKHLAKQSLGLP